ncbi:hypothetical protein ACFTSF_10145 [Kribbella sp. NPDC056951]|uniref:hypothetical protein n=1 Tax=Kribbella sp. NPDC056951 TaxID=3345978 RepID=UPI003627168A
MTIAAPVVTGSFIARGQRSVLGKRQVEGVAASTGTLATTLVRLRPRDPESTCVVERRNGFFDPSCQAATLTDSERIRND